MRNPPINARALGKSGMEALRRGDAHAARVAFEEILAAGQADASIFLALAYACRNLKDADAAMHATDNVLGLEAQNLRALILKADLLDAAGDARGASAYYREVTKVAPPDSTLSAELREQVAHAKLMCEQYAVQFEKFLRDRLAESGLDESSSSQRFRQSLDILTGKKARYFQEPRYYFFPELPQIQFFDRNDFPWLDAVEEQTSAIRAELLEVLRNDAAFEPYVKGDSARPTRNKGGMLNNPDWSAFYLWKNGKEISENVARCPNTMKALAGVPLARMNNRSPSILFSLLRPGARIPPHNGFVNSRLICHLPLVVPRGCSFRVGNEVREWVEGKAWVFDDTIEHEAWNDSRETRVILLFEVWRPELTSEERDLVTAMFDAIDTHSGTKQIWEI
ncbi:MAG: aspartyl/asparaginyl beta-hydroxylase domain-containing protein [Betaproteobacteria bacterium]